MRRALLRLFLLVIVASASVAPAAATPPTLPSATPTSTTSTTSSTSTSTSVPHTTIISIGPAVPTASIISIGPATTTSTVPTSTTTTKPGPVAPTRAGTPVRGMAGEQAAGPSPLLQLLAATEAARRQLDAQVAEAEAELAQQEAELAAARAALQVAEGQVGEARAAVGLGAGLVAQLDEALRILSAAESIASAASKLRTTPVGYPLATGHTAKDDFDRAKKALDEARAIREQTVARLHQATLTVQAGGDRIDEARRLVANLAEEIQQRRNALANLHQQLAAALAVGPVTASTTSAVHALTTEAGAIAPPSPLALADIPADYLDLYQRQAMTCPGLSWAVLAAIGSIETAHGRSTATGVHTGANSAGAMGPMQFLDPTWAAYGVDGDGDGAKDVYAPADAVAGAANYLCANGGGHLASLTSAIWNYNHANWYVASVIQLAGAYGSSSLQAPPGPVDPAQLVDRPNLALTPEARSDILGGIVDRRVVELLAAVAVHHHIGVSVIKTGHSMLVHNTDRVSNHYACDGCPGRGVDISEVDGMAVDSSNPAALELALTILTTDAPLRPDEFGSPWPDLQRFPGGFSDDDHQDHLHLGWSA